MPNYNEMGSNPELDQSNQATQLLKQLLSFATAEEIQSDLNEIFRGFLASDLSDDREVRAKLSETNYFINDFLTKVGKLTSINSFQNANQH